MPEGPVDPRVRLRWRLRRAGRAVARAWARLKARGPCQMCPHDLREHDCYGCMDSTAGPLSCGCPNRLAGVVR